MDCDKKHKKFTYLYINWRNFIKLNNSGFNEEDFAVHPDELEVSGFTFFR